MGAVIASRYRPPPCPRKACGSPKTQLVGYAVMADHIVDCFVCHACTRTFNQRSDDPNDSRFKEIRADDRTGIADSFS